MARRQDDVFRVEFGIIISSADMERKELISRTAASHQGSSRGAGVGLGCSHVSHLYKQAVGITGGGTFRDNHVP